MRYWPARGRVWLVSAAVVVGIVIAAVRFGPTAALSLSLAVPASDAWLGRALSDPVRREIVLETRGRTIPADVYRPPTTRGALVLVHGLSRAGRRHPELVRLARLLAQHGLLVVVPEFAGLAAFRLDGAEVDDVRAALRYALRESGAAGVAGFSFGAGPALLAAASYPDLPLVGSFGGYADLRDVVTYVTTGVHSFGGERYVQRQQEYNRWKLLALLVGFVDGERDRALLDTITRRKLGDPGADTAELEAQLGRAGRAVLNLVRNRQERAVAALLDDLSPRTREAMAALSPVSVVPRLRGRVLIAHGIADDSIPFTESLRLAAAAGDHAQLALLHTFHHTGAQPFGSSWLGRLGDAWSVTRLSDTLLTIGSAGAIVRRGGTTP